METIEINYGATENFIVEDSEAYSVSLYIAEDKDSPAVLVVGPELFVEGQAQIEVTADIPVGDYIYEFRFFDEDGNYENVSRDDCDGDECEFGTLTICPSILGESS